MTYNFKYYLNFTVVIFFFTFIQLYSKFTLWYTLFKNLFKFWECYRIKHISLIFDDFLSKTWKNWHFSMALCNVSLLSFCNRNIVLAISNRSWRKTIKRKNVRIESTREKEKKISFVDRQHTKQVARGGGWLAFFVYWLHCFHLY